MIHVVFDHANVAVLEGAIEIDETLQGNIIEIKDDYMVGPLGAIYETEGYQERKQWWEGVLQNSPYQDQLAIVDDKLTVHQLLTTLDENPEEEVWLWMAQNAHDVSGYYWLMTQLKEYAGRIQVLYLNNLPFINEKGQIFYPVYLHEIQPKEFLKAKKLARPITLSEFEVDPDEWKKIATEGSMVRFLEGGKKLVGKGEDFFDKEILSGLTGEAIKLNKAIQNILAKLKVKTGDAFIVHRLKSLAVLGKVEIIGNIEKGWKDWSVKLAN